jgi:hypothetical protein
MVTTNLDLLDRVLREPDRLLVEKSISAYEAFEFGYSSGKPQGTFHPLTTNHLRDFLVSKYQVPEGWPPNRSVRCYLKFQAGDDGPGLERYAALLNEFYQKYPQEQPQERANHEVANFAEMCDSIRRRPAMYFGNRKLLVSHVAFFNGRIEAEIESNDTSTTAELLAGFQGWLNARLPWSLNRPWYRTLLFYNMDMEERAIKEFWIYLKLFQDGEPPDALSPTAKHIFESGFDIETMSEEERISHRDAISRIFH